MQGTESVNLCELVQIEDSMSGARDNPSLPDHISRDGLRQAAEKRDLLERLVTLDAPVAEHAETMLRRLEKYEHILEEEGR